MSQALSFIYLVFDKAIDFIFNKALLFEGVSIGWVSIVIICFVIMIKSILNLPRGLTPNVKTQINIENYNEAENG